MTPEAAVTDFIDYIDGVRQTLLDEGKDPSDHLLTVALDGENWMFMSEFQHYDGAGHSCMNGIVAWQRTHRF